MTVDGIKNVWKRSDNPKIPNKLALLFQIGKTKMLSIKKGKSVPTKEPILILVVLILE